jgi:hypothetical protein
MDGMLVYTDRVGCLQGGVGVDPIGGTIHVDKVGGPHWTWDLSMQMDWCLLGHEGVCISELVSAWIQLGLCMAKEVCSLKWIWTST